MQVGERRTRQFELAARLEANRAAAMRVGETDQVAALVDRVPSRERLHARQHLADATRPLVGDGGEIFDAEAELLVLRPDPPLGLRFFAGPDVLDELIAVVDGGVVECVTRHEGPRCRRPFNGRPGGTQSRGMARAVQRPGGARCCGPPTASDTTSARESARCVPVNTDRNAERHDFATIQHQRRVKRRYPVWLQYS